jgi:hypothetical protein
MRSASTRAAVSQTSFAVSSDPTSLYTVFCLIGSISWKFLKLLKFNRLNVNSGQVRAGTAAKSFDRSRLQKVIFSPLIFSDTIPHTRSTTLTRVAVKNKDLKF